MVPPAQMLAIKNRIAYGFIFIVALAFLLTGCGPPGPRALLQGKRLLDEGKYTEAVDSLKTATTILFTNAQAWNYLGLAYHRTGQTTNAVDAYQKALTLNRNLLEARFNLGCLWLEQDNLDAAKAEFIAYTLRRPNAPEGWVKLGFTQLRSREIVAAEKSFSEGLRHNTQNPDAYNGLGLAQLQRSRPREAAQYFASALKQQPDHRAALLNLARVSQFNLNDPAGALARYREYLALKPKAADWDAVNTVAQALEQQLTPQRPSQTVLTPQPATNTASVKTQIVATRPAIQPKPEPSKPAPTVAPQPMTPAEVVTLPPEPVIKISPDNVAPSASTPETRVASEPQPVVANNTGQPEKRGFFQKLNPMNLFRNDSNLKPVTTPLPSEINGTQTSTSTTGTEVVKPSEPTPTSPTGQGYRYVSPRKPSPGNRAAAEREFAQGIKLRDGGRLSNAVQSFKQAVKSDPAYFEAQFNLALAEYEMKQFKKSLPVWEITLAIRPDSVDARYNFALALKAVNYPRDAANELEKIIASSSDETRAHLALGNLCAEQLQETARARVHYLKVLELSPNHPQAEPIRYWLVSNPQ